MSTPSAGLGGIMQFAHKTLKCMGCKAALPPGQSTLCKHCKGKEAELYIKSLQVVRAARTEQHHHPIAARHVSPAH